MFAPATLKLWYPGSKYILYVLEITYDAELPKVFDSVDRSKIANNDQLYLEWINLESVLLAEYGVFKRDNGEKGALPRFFKDMIRLLHASTHDAYPDLISAPSLLQPVIKKHVEQPVTQSLQDRVRQTVLDSESAGADGSNNYDDDDDDNDDDSNDKDTPITKNSDKKNVKKESSKDKAATTKSLDEEKKKKKKKSKKDESSEDEDAIMWPRSTSHSSTRTQSLRPRPTTTLSSPPTTTTTCSHSPPLEALSD
ncbi:hypothetical protein SAMD00019534_001200 [Acytostelium subglobosum LB1]|uniref:hypothetical protein n=1 Tax=Acytostelium subglobosum LB1 TaxID=1410327 RepID=UPI0006451D2A|nr:hypothetical protein SAMD00019534_001200 [Acytostelium subglobosum LB1]GAM16945.1 hypothetical protein SAMD00019534_001200 [Acytostelium subglobosum LB1]|eukprot:XP_012759007.1 hypothetical protein SAMD00019534_001200 [Acytostelium subglobosum LB1]